MGFITLDLRISRKWPGDSRVPVGGNCGDLPELKVCFHSSCKVQNDLTLSVSFPWSKGPEILSVSLCGRIRRGGLGRGGGEGSQSADPQSQEQAQALGTGRACSLALSLGFLVGEAELWGWEACNEDLKISRVKMLGRL